MASRALTRGHIIRLERGASEPLYWSNDDGWIGELDMATVFTDAEREQWAAFAATFEGSEWMPLEY